MKNKLLIDTENRKFQLNGEDITKYCVYLNLERDCSKDEDDFILTLKYEIPVSLGDKNDN
jgi:hypothetical protein